MDGVGGFPLAGGSCAEALTGIDDHSRLCVSAKLMARERTRAVCDGLRQALVSYGTPEQILTDIQSGWAVLSLSCRPARKDRCRPAPARRRYLTDWSAQRLLAC
jgi:hypothetical protein